MAGCSPAGRSRRRRDAREVIVFKARSASASRRLFAHELVYVDQYRKLGINRFARRYADNPQPIEEEARAKARRVVRRL